jgi:acyl-coenzyme A synthetase/AMP-(fatty) acid ligase
MTGPVVSKRYFRRDADTAASKIVDDRGRIWHRLGDCGYVDAKRRIWYCGRVAHIVQQRGVRVYSVPVEEVFNDLPGIERTALVQPADGAMPVVLVVEPKRAQTPEGHEQLRKVIQARASQLRIELDHVLFYPTHLPVDARHNSKIERGELAQWSGAQLALSTTA